MWVKLRRVWFQIPWNIGFGYVGSHLYGANPEKSQIFKLKSPVSHYCWCFAIVFANHAGMNLQWKASTPRYFKIVCSLFLTLRTHIIHWFCEKLSHEYFKEKQCIVFKTSMIWWQRGANVSTSIFAYLTTSSDDNHSNSIEY